MLKWLALGCLAQKYLRSLVFPALKRTSYRSVEECSLGFCLQVSRVAQVRLDFPRYARPFFCNPYNKKKKRESVKWCSMSRVSPRPQTLDTVHVGSEVGLLWARRKPEHCIRLPAHGFPLPAACYCDFGGSVATWATHSRILCTTVFQKSPDMGKSGLTEIKDSGIAQPVLDLDLKSDPSPSETSSLDESNLCSSFKYLLTLAKKEIYFF